MLVELLDTGIYQRMMQSANSSAGRLKTEADALDRRLREEYANATEEALADYRDQLSAQQVALAEARHQHEALTEAGRLADALASAETRRHVRELEWVQKLADIEQAEELAAKQVASDSST